MLKTLLTDPAYARRRYGINAYANLIVLSIAGDALSGLMLKTG
jgi:hypothetical protein